MSAHDVATDEDREYLADLDRREAEAESRGVLPDPVGGCSRQVWALHRSELFASLPTAQLQRLAAAARSRSLEPREEFLVCDETHVYVVETGGVKVVRETMDGRRLIEAVVESGGFFGGLTENPPEHHMVEALESTSLLQLPRDVLWTHIQENPRLALVVIQALDARQRKLSRRVASLVFKSVEMRVVEAILEMCKEYPDRCQHGLAVDVRLSQQDLADLVGASRESVSRVMSQMQKRDYVFRHGKVLCIASIERLERLSRAQT